MFHPAARISGGQSKDPEGAIPLPYGTREFSRARRPHILRARIYSHHDATKPTARLQTSTYTDTSWEEFPEAASRGTIPRDPSTARQRFWRGTECRGASLRMTGV